MTDQSNRRTILIGCAPKCPEIGSSYRARVFGALRTQRGTTGHKLPEVSWQMLGQLPPGVKRLPKNAINMIGTHKTHDSTPGGGMMIINGYTKLMNMIGLHSHRGTQERTSGVSNQGTK